MRVLSVFVVEEAVTFCGFEDSVVGRFALHVVKDESVICFRAKLAFCPPRVSVRFYQGVVNVFTKAMVERMVGCSGFSLFQEGEDERCIDIEGMEL